MEESQETKDEVMMMGGLCEEVVENILDRLPIKQLMRMKCLSKGWCGFIKRYRLSRPRASSSLFLCQYISKFEELNQNQVMVFNTKQNGELNLLESFTDNEISVLGSSNGLLFLGKLMITPPTSKLIIYVCNTTINPWKWDELPPLFDVKDCLGVSQHQRFFGMGLAFDDHNYKVVCSLLPVFKTSAEIQIFSSETREWIAHKVRIFNTSSLPQYFTFQSCVQHLFWKGKTYCAVRYQDWIMYAYDFQNNMVKYTELPKGDEVYCLGGFLFVSEGCLHYCQPIKDGFCVWKYIDDESLCDEVLLSNTVSVEEDQNTNENWKLKHKAEIKTSIFEDPDTYGPIVLRPCGFDEDIQILYIQLRRTILSYSFENQRFKVVWNFERPVHVH